MPSSTCATIGSTGEDCLVTQTGQYLMQLLSDCVKGRIDLDTYNQVRDHVIAAEKKSLRGPRDKRRKRVTDHGRGTRSGQTTRVLVRYCPDTSAARRAPPSSFAAALRKPYRGRRTKRVVLPSSLVAASDSLVIPVKNTTDTAHIKLEPRIGAILRSKGKLRKRIISIVRKLFIK